MLPAVVSREIEEGIKSFLRTTFPPSTPAFRHTLETFLDDPGRVFKGPYYGLRLPFRPAPDGELPFEEIAFPYRPHLHQARAFARLCGDRPKSTLVATGTGSGKTECFLYPILDACAARAGQRGIKAIVIYPMNALATDQARRFARAIWTDPKLKGLVTAGLFIGGESDQAVEMTADGVITNKGHMRTNPPDVLLTNYKMLDFLLLRPDEQGLWQYNAPETLRYLVVDELHTFDGAQSTDLACLIRRLKARLRTPAGHLCCVGTSATLGSAGAIEPLVKYARTVFAEPFAADGVIGEDVLGIDDLAQGCEVRFHGTPDPDDPKLVPGAAHGDADAYLAAQHRLWFGEEAPEPYSGDAARIVLGERLREHNLFRSLLRLAESSGRRIVSEEWLLHELGRMEAALADAAKAKPLLDSLLSLCAHARYKAPGSDAVGPLLRVHVHLWMRELSRMVASVEPAPRLAFSSNLKGEALKNHLPVLHCRECGAMGWGGTMRANDEQVSTNLQEFYKAFFGQLPTLRFFFPVDGPGGDGPPQEEFTHRLCGHCLTVNAADAKACSRCGLDDRLIHVRVHDRTRRRQNETEADVSCPYCESASGLTILGSRSASLTSVALGQIYASPFNLEKQALAFSDNVQDASHRSGFFAARTYRVNLRTAICRVLAETGTDVPLADLVPRFLEYWHRELDERDFIGIFLSPDMEWLHDYETLRDTGRLPGGSNLTRLVERRTAWEIASEFGYISRIGRTLEKSGTAIAYAEPRLLDETSARMRERLRERAGGFGSVSERELANLLSGLIHRLRTGGGIYHAELDAYVERGGDTFLLNRQNHMPKFSNAGRAPAFFYQGTARIQRFEKLVAGGTGVSWCQRWAIKTMRSVPGLDPESAGIVVEEAIQALTEAGLLEERSAQGNRIWGIQACRLKVTPRVELMTCRHCGHSISCAEPEKERWEGSPCLRAACRGTYGGQAPIQDYFGDLYRSGDVERIRTAEHTGMLEREAREQIEQRFMARGDDRRATDPNLLSCTPTLEMGVNIGDLSTVILCTVPPATSNYVQRVGRAGRKEGAAVSLTIAAAQPHDLYFFELPEDMMAGEIRPPGTFLDAPAVLERQFTAFCLDRWSEQSNPKPVLPHKIDAALDVVADPERKRGFPFDFFDFAESRLDRLIEGFLGLFGAEELAPESRRALERFGRGEHNGEGGLSEKILRRLTGLAKERDDLRRRLQKVGAAIRRNRDIAARDEALDAELEELRQARDGIYEMQKQINGKLTLNFFTDEGLLPNYAFPEEGVELRSVILKIREKPTEDGGKYKADTYEYVRPAAAALTELAPGNTFYVDGRRLKIDQIGMGVSPIESWHFCDACGYMERVEDLAAGRAECPACGSPNWSDASLKRDLVRLRQVVSTGFDRNTRSLDDKDQRDTEFYNRQESVVIPKDAERRAYQIRETQVPFGFEFLGKSTLRVVNFGQDFDSSQPFRLNGREVSYGGFVLCPECGKVQSRKAARGEEELKHDLSCRRRGAANPAPLKAVFLYRELQSEAIRVLLPSSRADEDTAMASFVAALHLGLRLHFEGNIEHLRGCVDDQPIPGTDMRRKYLVLYDQVPGGTGYLKQLSRDPANFLEVLRKALNHLTACECATKNEHDTDGCHRCILQARHRRDHADLSRTTAIQLLTAILEHADKLEAIGRVSDIDINPLIKSELEKMFMESLRAEPGCRLQAKIVRGKPGYLWCRGDAAWEIAPQVSVSAGAAVATPSIPDFVFYPVRPTVSRPVAVFLDGCMFHADEAAGNNRIALDVMQRQALVSSGQYWVWNYSWEDVRFRHAPEKISQTLFGEENAVRRNAQLVPLLLQGDESSFARGLVHASGWQLFLDFLSKPDPLPWTRVSYLYALAMPPPLCPIQLTAASEFIRWIAEPGGAVPAMPETGDADGVGGIYVDVSRHLAASVVSTREGVSARNPGGAFFCMRFDDDSACLAPEFSQHWRGFLRLLNRVQFLPHSHWTTVRGLKKGMFTGLADAYDYFLAGDHRPSLVPVPAELAGETDRQSDMEMAHPAILALLQRVRSERRPWPVLGYELLEGEQVVATAEAAWPDLKCALLHAGAQEDAEAFRQAKWSIHRFDENGLSDSVLDELLVALEGSA